MATASPSTASTTSSWRPVDEGRVDSFFDRARQGVHCSLFCGGKTCKHESWEKFLERKDVVPAFKGLNSQWVTDTVVASQRPATSLFAKYDLIPQFQAARMNGIFNLQEKGEHSSCGPDGIYASSGYSYHAESDLMPHGVRYYEFPWPDMTAPDNDIVLRSVQVMASHVKENGKVLVHCHAGLGRTGLMIACFLVYSQRMPSDAAIKLVRANRQGAVQTAKQVQFVIGFETYINYLGMMFPMQMSSGAKSSSAATTTAKNAAITLCSFMNRQRNFLHGDEALPYRYIPRHAHLLMCRLLRLVKAAPKENADKVMGAFAHTESTVSIDMKKVMLVRTELNAGTFDYEAATDVPLLAFVLIEWFRAMDEPVVCPSAVDDIAAFASTNYTVAATENPLGPDASSSGTTMGGGSNDSPTGVIRPTINTNISADPDASGSSDANFASPTIGYSAAMVTMSPSHQRLFKVIERTFLRHVRHTIACVLSFIETILLFTKPIEDKKARTARRHELLARIYDALTLAGSPKVGRVNATARTNAVNFLDMWAEAIGTNYFVSPSEVFNGYGATAGEGKEQQDEVMLTSVGSPTFQQAVLGGNFGPGASVGSSTFGSPLGDTISQGRIISAVYGASCGARFNSNASTTTNAQSDAFKPIAGGYASPGAGTDSTAGDGSPANTKGVAGVFATPNGSVRVDSHGNTTMTRQNSTSVDTRGGAVPSYHTAVPVSTPTSGF